jgi:hypothetical protein
MSVRTCVCVCVIECGCECASECVGDCECGCVNVRVPPNNFHTVVVLPYRTSRASNI